MARIVKTVVNSAVKCRIDTTFSSGQVTTKEISVGDTVEGLRYVYGDSVKSVSGIIKSIGYIVKQAGKTANSDDDITLTNLTIDASEQYHSNLVTVKAKQIVEDEGVENVATVRTYAKVVVDLDLTYSNNVTEHKCIESGDVLETVMILPDKEGDPVITGKFTVEGFSYLKVAANKVKITGVVLKNEKGDSKKYAFNKIVSFKEVTTVELKSTNGLSDIAAALNESNEVEVKLTVDTTVPPRDDGRITTLFVPSGKTLSVDLNGHSINTSAYAFYVTGGTLVIDDSTGEGVIHCKSRNNTYPAVYVNQGTCIMNGGLIDTTDPDYVGDEDNWMYGMVCANDGMFIMNGGTIHTDAASCLSITNGTAANEGASFIIKGNSKLITDNCAAIYLADNKNVILEDTVECGAIVARMGNIEVKGKAKVTNKMPAEIMFNLVDFCKRSGVEAMEGAITGMLGMYKTDTDNNDFSLSIGSGATVTSVNGPAIELVKASTKYDQNVNVIVSSSKSLKPKTGYDAVKIYEYEDLSAMATAQGKTFPAKASEVNLTVKVAGVQTYPVDEEG